MKIAITGHRPHKLGNEYNMKGKYSDKLQSYFDAIIQTYSPDTMISGMALGTDMQWALTALKNDIHLIAAIPCKDQEKRWPPKAQELYWRILRNDLTTVHYVSKDAYTNEVMQKRNEWMVDQLTGKDDMLVAVWDGSGGGTKNCIGYAELKLTQDQIYFIRPQFFFKQ